MRKRFLSALLALTMMVTLPGYSLAEETVGESESVTADSNAQEITITAEELSADDRTASDPADSTEAPGLSDTGDPADTAAPAGKETAEEVTEEVTEETEEETESDTQADNSVLTSESTMESLSFPSVSSAETNDELFAGYVDEVFGIEDNENVTENSGTGYQAAYGRVTIGSSLTGNDLIIYNELVKQIAEVANGSRSDTQFTVQTSLMNDNHGLTYTDDEFSVPLYQNGTWNSTAQSELQAKYSYNIKKILNALLADCPYELYWFDKTVGISYQTGVNYKANVNEITRQVSNYTVTTQTLTFSFAVAADYTADGSTTQGYTADSSKTGAATRAAANAQAIVSAAQSNGLSDYEKLVLYKNKICELTEYNQTAAAGQNVNYGDPWQLIYVFDGDTSTNVVCEGYSKAFQYLCDQTSFTSASIYTYSVSGTLSSGSSSSLHMWNIIHMDDGNTYLVDVTNCDSGTVGASDLLFLKGCTTRRTKTVQVSATSSTDAYSYTTQVHTYTCGKNKVSYTYDEDTASTWSESQRTLCKTDYGSGSAECSHVSADPVRENVVNATCTAEGSYDEVVYCTICSKELSRTAKTISATGHNMTKTEAAAATCTAAGNNEYYYCSSCMKYFKDSAGTQETTAEAEVLAATGHSFTSYTYNNDATCTADGTETADCDHNCGTRDTRTAANTAGHKLIVHGAKEAGCTETGNTVYYSCSQCGKLFEDTDGTRETTIEAVTLNALGHIDADSDYRCDRCGTDMSIKVTVAAAANMKAYADGIEVAVGADGTVSLPDKNVQTIVTVEYSSDDAATNYPIGSTMKVYFINTDGNGTVTAVRDSAFDGLMQYLGTSIRATGKQGIRIINGVPKTTMDSLKSGGLNGWTLVEAGMIAGNYEALKPADSQLTDGTLTLGASKTASAVFSSTPYKNYGANDGYTNGLTFNNMSACKVVLAIRPYMTITNGVQTVTLYGGIVHRSIYSVAKQSISSINRNTNPAAYNFVNNIIQYCES